MSSLGDLCNSLPIFGHIKAFVQITFGDKEEGRRTFFQATRTVAVLGAVGIGAAGGPVGCIAAATAAGVAYDAGTAVISNGKQVSGVVRIFQKPGKISSWVGAAIEIVGDGLSGIGGCFFNVGREAGVSAAKQAAKQVLIKEAEWAAQVAAKGLTRELAFHLSNATSDIVDAGNLNLFPISFNSYRQGLMGSHFNVVYIYNHYRSSNISLVVDSVAVFIRSFVCKATAAKC
jgi:hypothetical protein